MAGKNLLGLANKVIPIKKEEDVRLTTVKFREVTVRDTSSLNTTSPYLFSTRLTVCVNPFD